MEKSLFNPNRMELPAKLVLIPQFWHKEYYKKLKDKSYGTFRLLESDVLLFDNYTVLVGFLGYPHLLTLLEFIEGVKEKEIHFLGTAGSMNETINQPMPLQVSEIYPAGLLEQFAPEPFFTLHTYANCDFRRVKGVTVDIIQRETAPWLRNQVQKGMDFVEMELYPLRSFLGKPYHALVVSSDLLRENGIYVFPDKQRLASEFVNAYEFIVTRL